MKRTMGGAVLAALGMCLGSSTALADGTIKIGVLNDQSGPYADLTGLGSVDAARMAAEDAGGAVAGMKIEVVSADHLNKPDVGSSITRQWFERDGVDVVADVPNSGVALAVQDIAREKGKIALFSGPASTELSGAKCSPTGFEWTYDTYALAKGTGSAVTKAGGSTWFFLAADYAFGQALERDTAAVVEANGGKVLGDVKVPLNTADFSSFLLQAQGSKAKVIGLANAGGDTITSIKQAAEFGIVSGGQRLAGLLVTIGDIHALGLNTAQGLYLTESFYWDLNDETRLFAKRFYVRNKKMPTMIQAGTYSAVAHYLKAVKAIGNKDAMKVAAEMRKLPVHDFMTADAPVREDGRVARDMYLFEVKKPQESSQPWDYYKLVRKIPAAEVTPPLANSACPLVKKS